ncbi:MAG: hypothetical protein WCH99_18925 [Verrucomicrobiota bacterium]
MSQLLSTIRRKRRGQPFVCPHCGRRASDPITVEPPPVVPLVVPQDPVVLADGPQVKPVEISKPKKSRAVANKN